MLGFLTCTGAKWDCRGVVCWMRSYQRTRFSYSAACPTGKLACRSTSVSLRQSPACSFPLSDSSYMRSRSVLVAHHRPVDERGQDQVCQAGTKVRCKIGACC